MHSKIIDNDSGGERALWHMNPLATNNINPSGQLAPPICPSAGTYV